WQSSRVALDEYWTSKGVGGYSVWPGQEDEPDRYYDDNAWIVWAALDAYEVTRDSEDLLRAVKAYDFAIDGFDMKLEGGIYWREREKLSKNACINTPIAATAFILYRLTKDPKYFTMGEHLVAWTKKHLQDKDGLIMDNISVEGKVERTKWSYNTACYIRALIERERIAPSEANRAEANRVLDAARAHWYSKGSLLMKGPGMFGQHLLDAFYEADEVLGRKDLSAFATTSILEIAEKCADGQGLYGEDWNRKPRAGEELKLHFIASVLRVLLSARAAAK
ncbi:MAG TPA: glycoside hydrolase family 76 protein, partial [Fimbriimonas sp.]|nr:glycoside hydrolase family 76 protein [Fimbriimonas sp.]